MSASKSFKEEWTRVRDLAGGGQGTTFIAHRTDNKEFIAVIKLLNKNKDVDRRARMHREATALSTLEHPNITRFVDSNTEFFKDLDFSLFIVTEFIPGRTLSNIDFLNVTLEDKIVLFKVILETLNFCHQRGILHRDIKPDNIIVRNDNLHDPVILDFGLSFNSNDNDDDNLTPSGEQLGNRFLLLPEQKVGEISKRDFRSDIASTVGLFFYFITGQLPVVLNDEKNRKPHQTEKAKAIIDKIPQHQRDIINHIFDVGFENPIHRRWQTVQSLLDQIHILQNSTPTKMSNSEDYIRAIQEKMKSSEYEYIRQLDRNYQEIDKRVRDVLSNLRARLGPDWGHIQSGGNQWDGDNRIYRNRLAPANSAKKFEGETKIFAYATGDELVIKIEEGKESKEVFRQPLDGQKDWSGFETALMAHYLEEIHKKL